ncbi:MAG TPA: OB-fold nucleic acid binding domain-containing protein, partial [Phototrophicaceae bacterium]|nr:OB-fold nucleic acid binding domain-containing protein [Phototrophicaceae bacterium]
MPSALETLVKILKLEREQGYKNTAVIGGLGAYSGNWKNDAHAQARRPEHHILVDELFDILSVYEAVPTKDERAVKINYMLDRITGRVPAPPEYLSRMPPPPPPPPPAPPQEAEPRAEAPQTQEGTQQEQREPRAQIPAVEKPPRERREKRDRNKRHEQRDDNQGEQPSQEQTQSQSQNPPRQQQPQRQPQRQKDNREKERQPAKAAEGRMTADDDFSRLEFDTSGPRKPMKSDIPAQPRLVRPPRKPRKPMDVTEAADIMRGLNAPVEKVKGVGPKMAQLLNKLGIYTINDLLFFMPRRYDDYTQLSSINRLQPNQLVTVVGSVRHTEMRIASGGRKDFFMVIDDGTASMGVTFFGQYYLNRQVRVTQQVVLRGQTSMYQNRIQMTNPEIQYLELEDLQKVGIVPVYPLTDGLNART